MGVPSVSIGLVGFGSIARTHLSALRALPATRTLAVRPVVSLIVSERHASLVEEAAALGVDRVVGSVDEALADGQVQLFDVTSRNDRHLRQATRVLDAGRALYIEKPIGPDCGRGPDARGARPIVDGGEPGRPGHALRARHGRGSGAGTCRRDRGPAPRPARCFHGSYLDPTGPSPGA